MCNTFSHFFEIKLRGNSEDDKLFLFGKYCLWRFTWQATDIKFRDVTGLFFLFIFKQTQFITSLLTFLIESTKYVLTWNQLTFFFVSTFHPSQIFHVWINHRYWPTATMLHQRISITCHLCKWGITVHRWWVLECRHIISRGLMQQCWRTIRTCREWKQ